MLQRALNAPADVDDVFQETWIRVVRSAHRYEPERLPTRLSHAILLLAAAAKEDFA